MPRTVAPPDAPFPAAVTRSACASAPLATFDGLMDAATRRNLRTRVDAERRQRTALPGSQAAMSQSPTFMCWEAADGDPAEALWLALVAKRWRAEGDT